MANSQDWSQLHSNWRLIKNRNNLPNKRELKTQTLIFKLDLGIYSTKNELSSCKPNIYIFLDYEILQIYGFLLFVNSYPVFPRLMTIKSHLPI